jgi:dephospho-CoA kinase
MRTLAYADPMARKRLEAIIHPLVKQESERRVAQAQNQGSACIVFDIPLLVESGSWRERLDHILVIDCPAELQFSRVMARSSLSLSEVQAVIASQASRERRLAAADTVIFNNHSSLDELEVELHQISHRFGLSCMPPPEQRKIPA